jgi:hypothetical protein
MPFHGLSCRLAILVALGAIAAGQVPARAADETARAFFQGKQIRFYTMGSPGGGYDTYMRALIPHLGWRGSAARPRSRCWGRSRRTIRWRT